MLNNTQQAIQFRQDEALKAKNSNPRADRMIKTTKKGIVTETFINNRYKDGSAFNETPLPDDLINIKKPDSNGSEKHFFAMIGVPLGILGAGTLFTGVLASVYRRKLAPESIQNASMDGFLSRIAKSARNLLSSSEKGPPLGMNINIQTESQFATYEALRDPNLKKILGAMAVFTFSSAAFALKNTVDGLKEIWVKKKEADIQRDFQEKMINIETRSFSGKKQLVRYLLNTKSQELDSINQAKQIAFSANKTEQGPGQKNQKSGPGILHLLAGGAAIAASVMLIRHTMKNIRKIGTLIENAVAKEKRQFEESLAGKTEKALAGDKKEFSTEKMAWELSRRKFSNAEARELLEKTKFSDETRAAIQHQVEENNAVYANPHKMYGVPGKATLYTYIDDVSGHLYNMIMNPSKFTASLFTGLTAVTSLGYAGTKFVEANKEVQVKKVNAQTDLDMHDKLVAVELKNFLTKKEASVSPLISDYKTYSDKNPDDTPSLKSKYNSIMDEIKNGPPFIYD